MILEFIIWLSKNPIQALTLSILDLCVLIPIIIWFKKKHNTNMGNQGANK